MSGKTNGRRNVENGILAKARNAVRPGQWKEAQKKAALRPTWPEARFYGLIFGMLDPREFSFQETIPTRICDHRVDARFGNIILELDGPGHHAFGDRSEHDRLVDQEYTTRGFMVIRAPDESELFLRLLQFIAAQCRQQALSILST